MHFNEKDIEKLATLSRINLTLEEKLKLLENLQKIIAYMDQLGEVDTEGVEPCYFVLKTHSNALREDEVSDTIPREVFLSNAPDHIGGMIKVPLVLKESI